MTNNDYILSTIKKVSTILTGLISISLINRYLGPELKGQYAFTMNIIEILFVVLSWGYVNLYPYEKKNKGADVLQKYISTIIIEFVFLMIIAFSLMVLKSKISLYAVILALYIMSFQFNQICMVENMRNNMVANIIMNVTNLLGSIVLFFLQRNIAYAFVLFGIKELVFIICTVWLNRNIIKSVCFKKGLKNSLYLMKIGFLPMLTTLLSSLNYKIDILSLKFLKVDDYHIGLYSLGLNVAQYVWVIPDIFKDVLTKRSATRNFITSTTFSLRMCSTAIITMFLIMLLIGKYIIRFMFGVEYDDSYPIVLFLFFGSYAMIFTKLIGVIYFSEGMTKKYFMILSVSVLFNVVLNAVLIPKLSIYGATLATISSYSVCGFLFLHDYSKKYHQSLGKMLLITKSDIDIIFSKIQSLKK